MSPAALTLREASHVTVYQDTPEMENRARVGSFSVSMLQC